MQDDGSLNAATEECDRQMETLSTNITTSESYLTNLASQLDHLQTEDEKEQPGAEGIPTTTWQMVM